MLPYRDSRITTIALISFFILVAAYAYYEGSGFLRGPTIDIENRVMHVSDPLIKIDGRAERIVSLSMNGKAISVTEEGNFSEPYLLTAGYNRIVLDARDRYGKKAERVIEIVYTQRASSTTATQ